MVKYSLLTLSSYLLLSFSVSAEQLTDPTKPPHYTQPVQQSVTTSESAQNSAITTKIQLTLDSTIVASHYKVAIINGVQYKVGDHLEDGSILKTIDYQQVTLRQPDNTVITLSISKPFISHLKSTAIN